MFFNVLLLRKVIPARSLKEKQREDVGRLDELGESGELLQVSGGGQWDQRTGNHIPGVLHASRGNTAAVKQLRI